VRAALYVTLEYAIGLEGNTLREGASSTAKYYRPWQVMIPVGLATSLSLLGDVSLYAVLPTHTDAAGVAVMSVGILLSANRWIRLLLNGPIGILYERWPRRRLFVPALFIGAFSTAIYAAADSFWPLLIGRLLWGLAWVGIWIGGNAIIIDMTHAGNLGRWIGLLQASFFLGASGGSLLGGVLTDVLGYNAAMGINAGAAFLGAAIALLFLPETRPDKNATDRENETPVTPQVVDPTRTDSLRESVSAIALFVVNRLVIAGILISTFSLFVVENFGDPAILFGRTFGVATLTGIALSANSLTSMIVAPIAGQISDGLRNRWIVAAVGLVIGLVGYVLFVIAPAAVALLGIPLVAAAGASNQAMAVALSREMAGAGQHGRRLGILFTAGDLASAIGPPLAFALIPLINIRGIYALSGSLLALLLLVTFYHSAKQIHRLSGRGSSI